VELLRDVRAQVKDAAVEDRFDRAVTTEDKVVGRAGNIEYVGKDADSKIIELREKGIEKIEADVEKFNIANPESSVSYDSESGELFNKFGVSESGKYDDRYASVDKSELPSDNPDSVQEHISKHIDTDFDKYRDFDPDKQDAQKDVDADSKENQVEQPDPAAETERVEVQETAAQGVEQPTQPEAETPIETDQTEKPPEVENELPSEIEGSHETDVQDTATDPPAESAVEATEPEGDSKTAIEEGASEIAPLEETTPVEANQASGGESSAEADEVEAMVAAAHGEDSHVVDPENPDEKVEVKPNETAASQPDESAGVAAVEAESSDQYREIIETYFADTEGMMIPEDDVIQPILDIFEGSGQSDFKEIFDTISEIMASQGNAMEQIDKFTDLIDGFIEASPIPGEAYDMFSNSMLEAAVPGDVSEAIMEEMLSLERIVEPMESGIQAEVTIGEQELVVSDNGIFDAMSGEPAGGFLDESSANNCFESSDQSLYDVGANVELPTSAMESGNPVDTDSLIPDMDMIQQPEVSVGDEVGGIPESAVEIPGGIEGVEAAEGASAVEGIEAAAAALL